MVPSGVDRARDAILDVSLTHPTPAIHKDSSGMRSHTLASLEVPHLFEYELDPIAFAYALEEFEGSVREEVADSKVARVVIGSTYALLGQHLWWKLKPPTALPLVVQNMTMDLDFQQTFGEYLWESLANKADLQDNELPLQLIHPSTGTPTDACKRFLEYWVGVMGEKVLKSASNHREKGIFFTWESFARSPAFVTSTTSKTNKKGWFHIPTNGGHSDACHMSMKPLVVNGDDTVNHHETREIMFQCMLTITIFLNGYWAESADMNTQDKYDANWKARNTH